MYEGFSRRWKTALMDKNPENKPDRQGVDMDSTSKEREDDG